MAANTIVCAVCGATGKVVSLQMVYGSKTLSGGTIVKHALIETHYDVDCPTCGRRTQIFPPRNESKGG